MAYARFASGYRAGGPNLSPGGVAAAPYGPDKTPNYEQGVKGEFLDHRLSIDGSLYYIDWNDTQLQLTNPQTNFAYSTNAGGAKSQGVELSIGARPLSGLTLAAWAVWNDAQLTEAFPPFGASGDRLPNSSRFSANVSLEQSFPVVNGATAVVGGTVGYAGERKGIFTAPERASYPDYTKVDLRAGMRFQAWSANLYVNNLTDRRGVVGGGAGGFPPFGFYFIQPRTLGMSVARTF
jgi:outer membrane receptor protein involved in Fe transport